ncbi:MAG: metallophosphoesterase [Oscillospiraceae bacterium]|nr:metallophosphoesterase [Oscillospiraceae bacterium]
MKKINRGAMMAAVSLLGWAAIENRAMLHVQKYQLNIPGLPSIVQISDLHKRKFGRHQEKLLAKIAALAPDCIVITGDVVSRDMRDFSQLAVFLKALRDIAPVYAVFGNHETDLPRFSRRKLAAVYRENDVVLLNQTIVPFGSFHIGGIAFPPDYYRGGGFLGYSGKRQCTAYELQERLGSCPPNTILLAHNPAWFPVYAQWGAMLTLSGHVHGGSVRLPFVGGLLAPERKFFPRYDKGLFRQGDAAMIVSGGLGKLRLFNPPEICMITSASQNGDDSY